MHLGCVANKLIHSLWFFFLFQELLQLSALSDLLSSGAAVLLLSVESRPAEDNQGGGGREDRGEMEGEGVP